MIDLDNFKIYNDTNGHLSGDKVLKKFASILENNCRSADVVARYGGDEFGVILPHTDSKRALTIGQRIIEKIDAEKIIVKTEEGKFPVTASIGMAQCPKEVCTPDDLISRADNALYQAKNSSNNKIIIYRD